LETRSIFSFAKVPVIVSIVFWFLYIFQTQHGLRLNVLVHMYHFIHHTIKYYDPHTI
jgi:hypothetical protein